MLFFFSVGEGAELIALGKAGGPRERSIAFDPGVGRAPELDGLPTR